jgi:hypothetical protein
MGENKKSAALVPFAIRQARLCDVGQITYIYNYWIEIEKGSM